MGFRAFFLHMRKFLPTHPILLFGLIPLLVIPLWMAAGTFKDWQYAFLPLSVWAWVCFFLASPDANFPKRMLRLRKLIKDPCFWGALGFMGFLLLQFWNSNLIRVPDFETMGWTYTSPKYPRLPWSINQEDAAEMLRWFGPVFTVFLIIRHAGSAFANGSLTLWVTLSAFLNAILALVHEFRGWEMMYYDVRNTGRDTYGSFGYPNHAATFFILMFSFAAGLFLRETLRERSERRIWVKIVFGVSMILFFFAAQFSASRAGMLGVWLVLFFVLLTLAVIGWPRLHPVHRLYGVFAVVGLLFFLVLGFQTFATATHLREFRQATVDVDANREISARFFQVQSAWDMWKDHPFYGVGGWGYRYLVGFYLDESQWHFLGTGKANVHNDFFQFLAEFGLVGMTLLAFVFLPAGLRLLKSAFIPPEWDESLWGDPYRFSAAFGLLLMIAHSMIDLPFRSPAVFMHGAMILAIASLPSPVTSVWPPKINWSDLTPGIRLNPIPKSVRQ